MKRVTKDHTSTCVLAAPEPACPIDGDMTLRAWGSAAHCHRAMLEFVANDEPDRVVIMYQAVIRPGPGILARTLAELLQDPALGSLAMMAVSQRVRHQISGLEAAAALFGVFGSDYLLLGSHLLGLSPPALVKALEDDDLEPTLQKLIAAIVADARPLADRLVIPAIERVDLMLTDHPIVASGERPADLIMDLPSMSAVETAAHSQIIGS